MFVQDPRTTNVGIAAVQTAFEGAHANTRDKLPLDEHPYDLRIPFGHEGRAALGVYPTTRKNYCTGGTPWFVAIECLSLPFRGALRLKWTLSFSAEAPILSCGRQPCREPHR